MALINSLATILGGREDRRTASMSLIELDQFGNMIPERRRSFQYFPETITDSRSVNWNEKNVIGGSHPIYQWMGASARTIGFEAVFTNELAPPVPATNSVQNVANTIQNLGGLVASVAKNPVGTAIGTLANPGNNQNGAKSYSVAIPSALAWLRSKTYPTYTKPPLRAVNVAQPPPKLVLLMPNSGITSQAGARWIDSVPVIMMSCNVTYEAFFRTGQPRIVTVSLEFAEIVQVGSSGWGFVGKDDIDVLWTNTYNVDNNQFENASVSPSLSSGLNVTQLPTTAGGING